MLLLQGQAKVKLAQSQNNVCRRRVSEVFLSTAENTNQINSFAN